MTEREWNTTDDPVALLECAAPTLSPRKLRLLALACCRTLAPLFAPPQLRTLAAAEQYADGLLSEEELRFHLVHLVPGGGWTRGDQVLAWGEALCALHAALYTESFADLYTSIPSHLRSFLTPYAPEAFQPAYNYVVFASIHAASAALAAQTVEERDKEQVLARAFHVHAHLFRDIIGDPFDDSIQQRIAGYAAQSSALRLLATHIYSTAAFELVPTLARVLILEGLNLPQIRKQLAAPHSHARGCWLVDAALGVR